MKPELTASGFGVMSALSDDASIDIEDIDPDGEHWMMAGTSCSAPMVAGAVALCLDAYPDADPGTINYELMMNAREDEFTGDTWPDVENQYWGAGKLGLPLLPALARVPTLTPIGLIALIGLLSVIAAISIRIRKRQ